MSESAGNAGTIAVEHKPDPALLDQRIAELAPDPRWQALAELLIDVRDKKVKFLISQRPGTDVAVYERTLGELSALAMITASPAFAQARVARRIERPANAA